MDAHLRNLRDLYGARPERTRERGFERTSSAESPCELVVDSARVRTQTLHRWVGGHFGVGGAAVGQNHTHAGQFVAGAARAVHRMVVRSELLKRRVA